MCLDMRVDTHAEFLWTVTNVDMRPCPVASWLHFPWDCPSLSERSRSQKALCCFLCSVSQLCLTLCNPMDCSTPGFPVLPNLPELAQTHGHWVSISIQPSHPLWFPSPHAFSLSQHQALFQWVGSSHQVAKVLNLQLQHLPFQWIFRVYFLQDWYPNRKK